MRIYYSGCVGGHASIKPNPQPELVLPTAAIMLSYSDIHNKYSRPVGRIKRLVKWRKKRAKDSRPRPG